jgi:hypothetical protein
MRPKLWNPDVDLILFDNEKGEAHLKDASLPREVPGAGGPIR